MVKRKEKKEKWEFNICECRYKGNVKSIFKTVVDGVAYEYVCLTCKGLIQKRRY